MGKILVIKGADFSAVAVKKIVIDIQVTSWVVGGMPVDLAGHGTATAIDPTTFGSLVTSTMLNTSNYIEVQGGQFVKLKVPVFKMDTTFGICFFDSSKTPIKSNYYVLETSESGKFESKEKTLTVPQNAAYLRVSWFQDTATYGEFEGKLLL